MTREEAIKKLEWALKNNTIYDENEALEYILAVKKGIEALEQEPCEDCISRKEVCDYIAEFVNHEYSTDREHEMVEHIIGGIQHLPSIQPKAKTGHWILTDDDFVYCSECEDSYYPRPIDASWYYCPHCGCKMFDPQESEG